MKNVNNTSNMLDQPMAVIQRGEELYSMLKDKPENFNKLEIDETLALENWRRNAFIVVYDGHICHYLCTG